MIVCPHKFGLSHHLFIVFSTYIVGSTLFGYYFCFSHKYIGLAYFLVHQRPTVVVGITSIITTTCEVFECPLRYFQFIAKASPRVSTTRISIAPHSRIVGYGSKYGSVELLFHSSIIEYLFF